MAGSRRGTGTPADWALLDAHMRLGGEVRLRIVRKKPANVPKGAVFATTYTSPIRRRMIGWVVADPGGCTIAVMGKVEGSASHITNPYEVWMAVPSMAATYEISRRLCVLRAVRELYLSRSLRPPAWIDQEMFEEHSAAVKISRKREARARRSPPR